MITSNPVIHKSRTKEYVHNSFDGTHFNCAIVQVFWSRLSIVEVPFQNISPFSTRIKPNLFDTLWDANGSNAQRNNRRKMGMLISSQKLTRCFSIISERMPLQTRKQADCLKWQSYLYCISVASLGVEEIKLFTKEHIRWNLQTVLAIYSSLKIW